MHLSQKNGSRGAFFLISSFLKGLTYSALFLNQIVLSLALLILCLSILYNPRYITDPAKSKTDSWANVYRDERTFS